MKRVFLAYFPSSRFWGADFLAQGIASALRKLGFDARAVVTDIDHGLKGIDVGGDDWVIAMGGAGVWGLTQTPDGFTRQAEWKNVTIGLYNFNETGEEGTATYDYWKKKLYDDVVEKLGREVDFILDYSPHAEAWHRDTLKAPAVFCPLGYDEAFEIRPKGPAVHDIVMLARKPVAHQEHIRRIPMVKYLHDHRIALVTLPRHILSRKFRADPRRLSWVKEYLKAKVWLHLNRVKGWCNFADIRIMAYGFCNKLCVVSEPASWSPPIVNNIHWVVRPFDEIPKTCRRLLRNQKMREEIGRNAYDFVKRHWRMDAHLERALSSLGLL